MLEEVQKEADLFGVELEKAKALISFDEKRKTVHEMQEQSEQADFWQNQEQASTHMQKLSALTSELEPWEKLDSGLHDLQELLQLKDQSIAGELKKQLSDLRTSYENVKKILRFNGQYDRNNALLSIHAGAGGTDAQDWAQMLLRMYTRWAEASGIKAEVIDESSGEEAGIKSVSLLFSGSNAYGKLRGEHGVHRLVRLSPFNADAKRQTSFAKVEVLPEIGEPQDLPIDESDLKIDVFRSGGKGGQSVNTTDSAVRITHIPTGIVVSIQNERSQLQNKETAMTILRSKLAQLQMEQHKESLAEIKGPNQSAEWGNQIRSYVLHPYTMVKDLRTRYETTNAQSVLDGDLDAFIDAYLEQIL